MFTIEAKKLKQVVKIFRKETDPKAKKSELEASILADWEEGEEHQEWLDVATPQEIADWLHSFYR